jgi:PKD repeat protein
MLKSVLFFLGFISCISICNAQQEATGSFFYSHQKVMDSVFYSHQEIADSVYHSHFDSLCFHFNELTFIDFDVSQRSGCDTLTTQLLNLTKHSPDDTLSYFWSVFNEEQAIIFNFIEENPEVFIAEPGNYHVELVITNTHGCSDTLIKYNVISIDKMPHVDFTFTPENALFAEYLGEVEFTNLTAPELLQNPTVVWRWDFGDSEINARAESPMHLFSSWGDYHTTFHLKTKNGCEVALTKTIIIEDELFFPDTLQANSDFFPFIFAITNLNINIPKDDSNEFRTNYLFIYNESGVNVYEQKNYDTYKKDGIIVEGIYSFPVEGLLKGIYYYSFYYKGKSKMVHYSGTFWVI